MRYFLVLIPLLAFGRVSPATTVQDVFARMDKAAPAFTGLEAQLKKTSYTKVLDDTSLESGAVRMRRDKPKSLQVLIDFVAPDARTVAFAGKKAEIYYPKMKVVHEYDLGKHRELVDQFLLVGFGVTGRDLESAYTVKLAGEETVSGEKTSHLELTPKSAAVRDKVARVDLWIGEAGHPVQQKFTEPSGNYTLFTYTGMKLNPALSDDKLKLKLPKGVKRERPQK